MDQTTSSYIEIEAQEIYHSELENKQHRDWGTRELSYWIREETKVLFCGLMIRENTWWFILYVDRDVRIKNKNERAKRYLYIVFFDKENSFLEFTWITRKKPHLEYKTLITPPIFV